VTLVGMAFLVVMVQTTGPCDSVSVPVEQVEGPAAKRPCSAG
jgi:hypothetical protein